MTTICTMQWPFVQIHGEGEYVFLELEVYDPGHPHRLVVRSDPTGDLAYLDVEGHRFFRLNPGLRDALKQRVAAMTLVR